MAFMCHALYRTRGLNQKQKFRLFDCLYQSVPFNENVGQQTLCLLLLACIFTNQSQSQNMDDSLLGSVSFVVSTQLFKEVMVI